jgi:hypothetical protein
MNRRRLHLKVIAMAALVVACSDGDPVADTRPDLTDNAYCHLLWDQQLAPIGWEFGRFMSDCVEGLDAGFTRQTTRQIYEDNKESGG